MAPFSYVLIGIIIIIFYRNSKNIKDLLKELLILELVFACGRINYGSFITVNGIEFEYNDIVLGVLFFVSVIIFASGFNVKRDLLFYSFALLVVIIIGMILCQQFPAEVNVVDYDHSWDRYFRGDESQLTRVHFSTQGYLQLIRIIIFIVLLNIAGSILDFQDWKDILKTVLNFLKINIVYAILEAIMKWLLHIDSQHYLYLIFGHGRATGGSFERLQGLCREPAYFALGLFNFVLLSFLYNRINDKPMIDIWCILGIILGTISGSFTFVICLFALILLYFKLFNNELSDRQASIYSICSFLILLGSVYVIFSAPFLNFASRSSIESLNRIAESVKQFKNGLSGTYIIGQDISSETVRLVGAIITIKASLARPFFGLGIGSTYCVSGIISISSNVGFLGLFFWIEVIFSKYINL